MDAKYTASMRNEPNLPGLEAEEWTFLRPVSTLGRVYTLTRDHWRAMAPNEPNLGRFWATNAGRAEKQSQSAGSGIGAAEAGSGRPEGAEMARFAAKKRQIPRTF